MTENSNPNVRVTAPNYLGDAREAAQEIRKELQRVAKEQMATSPLVRKTFHREVTVEVSEGDGRTLIARLVPYNEVATVNDGAGPYQEVFLPGAFQAQMRAANRIKAFLNFRHRQSIQDMIGHATKIEDRTDGLHGELRVLENPDGDKALQLVHAGMLDRLSIEFEPLKDQIVNGITQRVKARLVGVALVPEGAYAGAEVLAVREEPDDDDDNGEPAPVPDTARRPKPMDPDQRERLETLGIDVARRPKPMDEAFAERLKRLGVDTALRAFTDKEWDGSAAKYEDTDAYCAACLIDDNAAGAEKVQARCHLPIKEPDGTVNINAVRNALARVNQVQTSAANKAVARRRLQQLIKQFNG